MAYTRYRTAAFGASKSGLATVGYTLQGGTRITTGVAEVGTGTGVYGATVTIPDGFAGSILWDSGEASPVFVAGSINANDNAQPIDLTQTLVDVKTSTVGGALHGAWAVAFGKMILDSTNKLLELFGFNSQATPLVTFDLDSGSSPTTRTPQ